jgi:PAS domain S-box-containing protein
VTGEEPEGGRDVRVVLVDDDPAVRSVTAENLEHQSGHLHVVATASVDEALNWICAGGVDCIVSDYDMPGTDGIQFLRLVRERDADVPFVLYTGRGSEEVASEAISAGVTDYLRKSADSDVFAVLSNRIENLVAAYRAAQAVEETRTRYQKLLEHSADYVLTVDEDATIQYVSPSVTRVLGYAPTEFTGNAFEFIHADDRERVAGEFFEFVAEPGSERVVQFRGRHADGSWRWLEVRGRNTLEDPDIDGIVLSARDITGRKRDESRLEAFADAYPDIAFVIDEDGCYREYIASPATSRLLYDDPGAIVGRRMHEVFPDRVADRHLSVVKSVIETAEARTFEYRLEVPAGDRWFEARVVPMTLQLDGERTVLFVTRDMTDRYEREQRLREERARFEAVFEGASDAIVVTDDDGRYVGVNPAACELFGLPEQELLGRTVAEFAAAEVDVEGSWDSFQEAGMDTGEFPLRRPDGTVRRVEYAAVTDIRPGEHLSVLRVANEDGDGSTAGRDGGGDSGRGAETTTPGTD